MSIKAVGQSDPQSSRVRRRHGGGSSTRSNSCEKWAWKKKEKSAPNNATIAYEDNNHSIINILDDGTRRLNSKIDKSGDGGNTRRDGGCGSNNQPLIVEGVRHKDINISGGGDINNGAGRGSNPSNNDGGGSGSRVSPNSGHKDVGRNHGQGLCWSSNLEDVVQKSVIPAVSAFLQVSQLFTGAEATYMWISFSSFLVYCLLLTLNNSILIGYLKLIFGPMALVGSICICIHSDKRHIILIICAILIILIIIYRVLKRSKQLQPCGLPV